MRQWLDNYHALRRLTRELCELHWQEVLGREGKRGRAKAEPAGAGSAGRDHAGEAR